jgi:hypothetical protein
MSAAPSPLAAASGMSGRWPIHDIQRLPERSIAVKRFRQMGQSSAARSDGATKDNIVSDGAAYTFEVRTRFTVPMPRYHGLLNPTNGLPCQPVSMTGVGPGT